MTERASIALYVGAIKGKPEDTLQALFGEKKRSIILKLSA